MIVAKASYELSDPTVDSQMVTLKSSGADLFYNITTPKFGAQAIKKAAELGWKPVHILDINATPGQPDAGAGRPRQRQGHHLRQLRQGPARPAMGQR